MLLDRRITLRPSNAREQTGYAYTVDMTTQEATETDTLSISKDSAFHILQNPRRRAVLRYILEHDDQDQFRMQTVIEEVAAWDHDTTVQQLAADQRQRVYIALYQSHLPKLDAYGVIECDQGIIEPTPLIYALAPYLADGLHADNTNPDLIVAEDKRSERSLSAAVSTIFSQ